MFRKVKSKCKICGIILDDGNFVRHLTAEHKLTNEEYYLQILHGTRGSCLNCGNPTKFLSVLRGYKEFCNGSCGTQYYWRICDNTERKNKIGRALSKPKIEKVCLQCGTTFLVKPSYADHNFDSKKCSRAFYRGVPTWNKGLTKETDERVMGYAVTIKNSDKCKAQRIERGHKSGQARSKRMKEDPEYREWFIERSTMKALKAASDNSKNGKLSSCEQQVDELIQEYKLPYEYTGNGKVWITSEGVHMCPDFTNTNSCKIVIEAFADFFKEKRYGSVENYKRERTRLFGNFGWKVIYIDEHDLKRSDWKEHCLSKIKETESEYLTQHN